MASIEPGAVFAGHEIIEEIGSGGMGVVYRAREVSLDRDVALKMISPLLAGDEEHRQRFLREAKLAASLDHPNILPVYRVDEHEGVLFSTSLLVEGGDLKVEVGRVGAMSETRVASILGQLSSALGAAHDKGLIHRDVKPQNVLVAGERVYLADFGLAKELGGGGSLTLTGEVMGTLDFMAPEQARGENVGPEADIYALGCIAFYCLTGAVPFPASSAAEAIHAHGYARPPKPSSLRPEIDRGWDGVIGRALSKNVDERPASARAFKGAVPSTALGATESRRPSGLQVRRPPRLAIFGLGLLIAVGLALFHRVAPPPLIPLVTSRSLPGGAEAIDISPRDNDLWILARMPDAGLRVFVLAEDDSLDPLPQPYLPSYGGASPAPRPTIGAIAIQDDHLLFVGDTANRIGPSSTDEPLQVIAARIRHDQLGPPTSRPVSRQFAAFPDGPGRYSNTQLELGALQLYQGLFRPGESTRDSRAPLVIVNVTGTSSASSPRTLWRSTIAVPLAKKGAARTAVLFRSNSQRPSAPSSVIASSQAGTAVSTALDDAVGVVTPFRQNVPKVMLMETAGLQQIGPSIDDATYTLRNEFLVCSDAGSPTLGARSVADVGTSDPGEIPHDLTFPPDAETAVPFCGRSAIAFDGRGAGVFGSVWMLSPDGRRIVVAPLYNSRITNGAPDITAIGESREFRMPEGGPNASSLIAGSLSRVWVACGSTVYRIDNRAVLRPLDDSREPVPTDPERQIQSGNVTGEPGVAHSSSSQTWRVGSQSPAAGVAGRSRSLQSAVDG